MGEFGMEQDLKRKLKADIMQGFSYDRQMSDEEVSQTIDLEIFAHTDKEDMTLGERLKLQRELFDSFRRLDILQELVDDPAVTEIMVNGPGEIFIETGGKIGRWERSFESKEQLLDLIQQIVGRVQPEASRVQEICRPATSRLSSPLGTKQR